MTDIKPDHPYEILSILSICPNACFFIANQTYIVYVFTYLADIIFHLFSLKPDPAHLRPFQ